jgi:superfamily II DNA helicase RecQ
MDATARAKSQSRFMRGKARIVVATVAFGLGIDKADIVGVSTD